MDSWLASFQTDVATSCRIFEGACPHTGGFFVLRAVLESQGRNPFPVHPYSNVLLGAPATFTLIQSYNTGTPFATADVLDSLWTHFGSDRANRCSTAVIGAVINFASAAVDAVDSRRLAFLCLSGIWRLVQRWKLRRRSKMSSKTAS